MTFLNRCIDWYYQLRRSFRRFCNDSREFKLSVLLVLLNLIVLFVILFFITPIRY